MCSKNLHRRSDVGFTQPSVMTRTPQNMLQVEFFHFGEVATGTMTAAAAQSVRPSSRPPVVRQSLSQLISIVACRAEGEGGRPPTDGSDGSSSFFLNELVLCYNFRVVAEQPDLTRGHRGGFLKRNVLGPRLFLDPSHRPSVLTEGPNERRRRRKRRDDMTFGEIGE